ncbi:MAG: hypothetical protein ABI343_06975 [Burkholderiaceae bacterium]
MSALTEIFSPLGGTLMCWYMDVVSLKRGRRTGMGAPEKQCHALQEVPSILSPKFFRRLSTVDMLCSLRKGFSNGEETHPLHVFSRKPDMNKVLATLIAALFAAGAYAQTTAPAKASTSVATPVAAAPAAAAPAAAAPAAASANAEAKPSAKAEAAKMKHEKMAAKKAAAAEKKAAAAKAKEERTAAKKAKMHSKEVVAKKEEAKK